MFDLPQEWFLSNSFLSFLQITRILLFFYMLLFFFLQKMGPLRIMIWYWKSGFSPLWFLVTAYCGILFSDSSELLFKRPWSLSCLTVEVSSCLLIKKLIIWQGFLLKGKESKMKRKENSPGLSWLVWSLAGPLLQC